MAVGGYGRREMTRHNDVDLVVLHDERWALDEVGGLMRLVGDRMWSDGYKLDAAVRTPAETIELARTDHRVAMGMLDARTVAGDSGLVMVLRSAVLADWRRLARQQLAAVREARDRRLGRAGLLAHAAVPDLKESAGGLRDGVMLRAMVATWLIDVPHAEVEALRTELLDVRDTVHEVAGRCTEKLETALVPDVAAALGMAPVELDLHVRGVGRRLAHLTSRAWRRLDDVFAGDRRGTITASGPIVRPLGIGIGLLGGDVIVTRPTDIASDPEVALRVAAAACRTGRPVDAGTAARLGRSLTDLPVPWPASSTRLMVELLSSGAALPEVWDELDFGGVVDHWLPEWSTIRLRGSSSPVHTFTVDRHSLETCRIAAELRREVGRPDLLVVAALLHDIGKGVDGDHSERGAPIAEAVARRWGFDAGDAATVARLVRWHLLLPSIATRRDIEDPVTAAAVADIVQDVAFLDLLAALTECDARATGHTAWTPWRRGLVEGLVRKTRDHLSSGPPVAAATGYEGWPAATPLPDIDAFSRAGETFSLTVEQQDGGSLLTVLTSDSPGIMSRVAGGLALAGLEVRSARSVTMDGVAASLWEVTRIDVDAQRTAARLRGVLTGETDLSSRLAVEPVADQAPARVEVLADMAASATLLGVRAADRRGLLWTVCRDIAALGHSIRSAHVSTYGDEARDVFYVVGPGGRPLSDDAAAQLRDRVAVTLG